MTENYPSSSSKDWRNAKSTVERVASEMRNRTQQEKDWINEYPFDTETPEDKKSFAVFMLASDLSRLSEAVNATKTVRALARIGFLAPQIDPAYDPGISPQLYASLGVEINGISPALLLERRQELARKMPVETYSHMLLYSEYPDPENITDVTHNYFPVTAFSEPDLRDLIKKSNYPNHIKTTLRDLSSTYKQAQKQVIKHFFEPDSKHFPAICALYDEVITHGSPLQIDLFSSQILGINTSEKGRFAYSSLVELVKQADHPELYDECLAAIEDSFDGILGEEAYELLDLEQSPDAEPDSNLFSELYRTRQQLIKSTNDTDGSIELPDGQYGQLELNEPKVYYHKSRANTQVYVAADMKTANGGVIPLELLLSEKQRYAWGFLRTNTEVPELFNVSVQAADDILNHALAKSKQPIATTSSQIMPAPKKEHHRDEIYDLRKQHLDEHRQLQDQPSEIALSNEQDVNQKYEIVFPEEIAESLKEERLSDALKAIEKFDKGLITAKPLRYLSLARGKDEDLYSIRKDRTRVLLNREGNVLTVVNADMRAKIYRVRK